MARPACGRSPEHVNARWLLAIDTSTEQAGIALFDGERLALETWPAGRQHTTTVLPAIERLLAACGLTLGDVGAIAVAIGPGSFTGLRVGLSLAKGLVIATPRALIGVPTLDLVAAQVAPCGARCVAVIPAGRGRVVWAPYGAAGNGETPRNTSFGEFVTAMGQAGGIPIVGELAREQRDRLAALGARLAPVSLGLTRVDALATIGEQRWRAGDVDDAASMEPRYLHGRPNPR